jgi:Putative auto-transporter adhesin, head GIN domain
MVLERILWIGCAAFALSACDSRHVGSRRSTTTETRAVTNFDAIEFQGDGRIEITVGEVAELTVRGQPGVLGRTQTRVTDNTLHIEVEREDWTWGRDGERLTVFIKVPQLRSLQLDGGSDVRLKGFNGGESSIDVNGTARIRASGALDRLTARLAGAGYADLSRLIAKDAKVTLDGVGSVVVHAEESLEATMNGVGAIFYAGTPSKVSRSLNGLGTIGKAEQDRERRREHNRGWERGWDREHNWSEGDPASEDEEDAETI